VKRVDLVRHLRAYGCTILREGAKHSVIVNAATRRHATLPRHREIKPRLSLAIYRQLGVPDRPK
jgi:mRNA interferase HicA